MVDDPVSPFSSAEVLHLSGASPLAGATAVLIILVPGLPRISSCNFLEIIYTARGFKVISKWHDGVIVRNPPLSISGVSEICYIIPERFYASIPLRAML